MLLYCIELDQCSTALLVAVRSGVGCYRLELIAALHSNIHVTFSEGINALVVSQRIELAVRVIRLVPVRVDRHERPRRKRNSRYSVRIERLAVHLAYGQIIAVRATVVLINDVARH